MHAQSIPEQTPLDLPPEEVNTHIEQRVEPVYPPEAIAAHIAGDVILHIEIGRGGQITRAYGLNGPEILRRAAETAVQRWLYRPFVEHHFLVLVESTVTVHFHLPGALPTRDEKVADAFFPILDRCSGLIRHQVELEKGVSVCRQAAELADHFETNSHSLQRSRATSLLAQALLAVSRYEEALEYANKAVAIAQQGPEDDLASSSIFFTRARIQLSLGHYDKADEDMDKAEASLKKLLDSSIETGNEMLYRFQMKMMLLFHAHLFSVWGKPDQEGEMMDAAMNI